MPAKKKITKEKILRISLKILREKGYEELNIKELVKELGCSTQPIYLSFSGMEELRKELTPLVIEEFKRYMEEDGTIRLYDMRYISFAKEEPHLFSFLFMRANAYTEMKELLLPTIESSVQELMGTYHIDHTKAELLHDQLWMHAHGIASMIATHFCDWNMNEVQRRLQDCKDSFLKKYQA